MKICPLLAIARDENNLCMGNLCAWCLHDEGQPEPLDQCAIEVLARILLRGAY